jgi:hypothetical protein
MAEVLKPLAEGVPSPRESPHHSHAQDKISLSANDVSI